MQEEFK